IFEIDIPGNTDYYTFPTRDLFTKAAIHIAKGGSLFELGDQLNKLYEKVPFQPATTENAIIGKAIYIDRYENIFTNISSALFKSVGKNRKFTIEFSASRYKLDSICSAYSDAHDGDILALFSTTGLLEIAINHGNAASLLGLQVDDTIRIQFAE
ncbi:MAG TPA: SAM-dependent chlorinase/fluorinase, partial [Bacteroidales bacterium]|nr:SAM-dependent chlorinase/fluorinase [Bacteroidales bacterium]